MSNECYTEAWQGRTGGWLRLQVKVHALCGVIKPHSPHVPTLDRVQELGVHHLQ